MNFKVIFQREVIVTDEVERLIEADTAEEAQAKAEAMAEEFNRSCPDDVYSIAGGECQDWAVVVGLISNPVPAEA